ncbi:SGNH/GDSL hydrolase family protein [Streptomyces paludis]|uniref:SGNH/GDSL hydrolase family protein n=1 Tax=Streptomyces paludis TaxID=2282738 RepID=A0A345HIR2_9ACTN|nr:SGNH/GDSL hydrolase family protein [Streptomyces paludis]AXG76586.1 SGNH/GDSL hydrolase family protein [Streptomyces paludis]
MRICGQASLAGGLACGVFLTAVFVGRPGDDGTAAPAPPRGPYVAMGDSYTSGPRIPDRTGLPAGCDRSDRNYPALVAERLGIGPADFRDMSCGGATVADLSGPQSTDEGTNPAQLSALSATTRLVTVGIGGNDLGFADLVTRCVEAGVLHSLLGGAAGGSADDAPCRDTYGATGADGIRRRVDAAGERLSSALDEMRRRAPHARMYVVGYPAVLPPGGSGCDGEMGLAEGDAAFLHGEEQHLNAVLRQRAEAAGAGYVDTYTPSVGHDACSARETRWIEPLVPRSPAAPVHPNERGESGMADAVLRTIGAAA